MQRRELIIFLGGAVAAWPVTVRAQQPQLMQRIGVLMAHAENDPEGQVFVASCSTRRQRRIATFT
jgi:hypothetical protein